MRSSLGLVWLAVIACDPGSVECGEYTEEVDGACEQVSPPAPTLADAYIELGDCPGLAPGDGRIDLELGCADEVCSGRDFHETEAAMGGDAVCTGNSSVLRCTFANGAMVTVEDEDLDGEPDPGPIGWVRLGPAFDGTTTSGLGVGVEMRCFVDQLGTPVSGSVIPSGDTWFVDRATWSEPAAWALDRDGRPDRLVDQLILTREGTQ